MYPSFSLHDREDRVLARGTGVDEELDGVEEESGPGVGEGQGEVSGRSGEGTVCEVSGHRCS